MYPDEHEQSKFGPTTLSCYGGCANNPGAIKMKMHPHFGKPHFSDLFLVENGPPHRVNIARIWLSFCRCRCSHQKLHRNDVTSRRGSSCLS